MAIVTNTILKTYMPELAQGTAADSDLTALIERVESAIANWLNYPFFYNGAKYGSFLDLYTYTLYFDGPDPKYPYMLDLNLKPVHSITSIHSDPYQEYEANTLIDATTYSLDVLKGQVRLKTKVAVDVFDKGDRSIKVVCSAGYTTNTAPSDLVHAICVWASQLQRNKHNQGKENVSQRGGSVTLSPKTMPLEVKELLNPYRLNGSVL
jgi:hypothetical protein